MHRILFATSEAFPLMKTGGLGDVSGSLPGALRGLNVDVRIIMPAYRDALQRAGQVRHVLDVAVPESATRAGLLETAMPDSGVPVYLVDHPLYFDRPGNPYLDEHGEPWPDNAERFALFSRVVAALACGRAGLPWQPEILHCNDWQSGLAPALLSLGSQRPAIVFTIHNLAYQGLFPYPTFRDLALPAVLWSPDALEFYGQLSFIKGGLVFADRITTVSPTYAQEIQTPAYGYGLEGLLRHRAADLVGILNGIDERTWDPACDPHLAQTYDSAHLADKARNKQALQRECGLPTDPGRALLGVVSRLVHQKGMDLLIEALPALMRLPVQLVVLGSGDRSYEAALRALAQRHPHRLAVRIGYDEGLAHRIEAGADMFLMPSRFEPCGLNQLYSLRYGTVPVVRRAGGLADTVVDANAQTLAAGTATGVVFDEASAQALRRAVVRALALYRQPQRWDAMRRAGMAQSFTWRSSARHYLDLYTLLAPGPERVSAGRA